MGLLKIIKFAVLDDMYTNVHTVHNTYSQHEEIAKS